MPSELIEEDMFSTEACARKALSEVDALVTPEGGKSIVSAAIRPPAPLLQEALANTIVLGLSEPADEYEVKTFGLVWLLLSANSSYNHDRLHGRKAVKVVEGHGHSR